MVCKKAKKEEEAFRRKSDLRLGKAFRTLKAFNKNSWFVDYFLFCGRIIGIYFVLTKFEEVNP